MMMLMWLTFPKLSHDALRNSRVNEDADRRMHPQVLDKPCMRNASQDAVTALQSYASTQDFAIKSCVLDQVWLQWLPKEDGSASGALDRLSARGPTRIAKDVQHTIRFLPLEHPHEPRSSLTALRNPHGLVLVLHSQCTDMFRNAALTA